MIYEGTLPRVETERLARAAPSRPSGRHGWSTRCSSAARGTEQESAGDLPEVSRPCGIVALQPVAGGAQPARLEAIRVGPQELLRIRPAEGALHAIALPSACERPVHEEEA